MAWHAPQPIGTPEPKPCQWPVVRLARLFYLAFLIGAAKLAYSYAFLRLFQLQPLPAPCIDNAQASSQSRLRSALPAGAMRPFASSTGAVACSCPSSPALSPEGRQQARDSGHSPFCGPPRDAHRAQICNSASPQAAAHKTPVLNPSSSALWLPCKFQPQPQRNCGTKPDVEVGLANPHSLQKARKLVRDRGDRARHARPFGVSQIPSRSDDDY